MAAYGPIPEGLPRPSQERRQGRQSTGKPRTHHTRGAATRTTHRGEGRTSPRKRFANAAGDSTTHIESLEETPSQMRHVRLDLSQRTPNPTRYCSSACVDAARLGAFEANGVGANTAASCTQPRNECSGTVHVGATMPRPCRGPAAGRSERSPVHRVGSSSSPHVPMPGPAVANAPSVSMARIASVEKLATRIDVYDIAVEEARQFFANRTLVHNCDEVAACAIPRRWTTSCSACGWATTRGCA